MAPFPPGPTARSSEGVLSSWSSQKSREAMTPLRPSVAEAECGFRRSDAGETAAKMVDCQTYETEHLNAVCCSRYSRTKYELTVMCRVKRPGLPGDASLGPKPVLMWDVLGQAAFCWEPPELPAAEGRQQVDWAKHCVVTELEGAGPDGWKTTLSWPQTSRALPRGIVLQVRLKAPDGSILPQPEHGSSSIKVALGAQLTHFASPTKRLVSERATVGSSQPADEVLREVVQMEERCQKAEARLKHFEALLAESRRHLLERPNPEALRALRNRLVEERLHRRRCQVELEELAERPRSFCLLTGGSKQGGSVTRVVGSNGEFRHEVQVASSHRRIGFDLVVTSSGHIEALCNEVQAALESGPNAASPHTTVLFVGQARERRSQGAFLGRVQHAVRARILQHFFQTLGGAEPNKELAVAMTHTELLQDNLHDAKRLHTLPANTLAQALSELRLEPELPWSSHGVLSLFAPRCGDDHLGLTVLDFAETSPELEEGWRGVSQRGSLDGGCSLSSAQATLQGVLQAAKACLTRTSEGHHSTLCPQGRLLVVAFVSQREADLMESISTLQLCDASKALTASTSVPSSRRSSTESLRRPEVLITPRSPRPTRPSSPSVVALKGGA